MLALSCLRAIIGFGVGAVDVVPPVADLRLLLEEASAGAEK